MISLMTGVLLWSAVHFFPRVAPYKRKKVMVKIGVLQYKLIFASLILFSIFLMVKGWQSYAPQQVFTPPAWSGLATMILMCPSILLFVAAQMPGNIKRYLRHPQLSGLILWSLAHLVSNGDSRSIILFAGLMIWAITQIQLTNWREDSPVKSERVSSGKDALVLLVSIFLYILFIYLHVYITGIALI